MSNIQIFSVVIKFYVKIKKHVKLIVISPHKVFPFYSVHVPMSTHSLYTQWGHTALSEAKALRRTEIVELLEAAAAKSREGSEVRDVYSR